MKTLASLLLVLLPLMFVSGCSSDKDRGMNRPDQRKDLPRAAPSESNK